jgi:phage-related protein
MPATEVRAFRDFDGTVPIQEWLDVLEEREPKVHAKCLARILELAEKGYELRRPLVDMLRDGIRELRVSYAGAHYRILYFFCGKNAVTLSHGIMKEGRVPDKEVELAVERMRLVEKSPDRYTANMGR